jgi:hypothetical protein
MTPMPAASPPTPPYPGQVPPKRHAGGWTHAVLVHPGLAIEGRGPAGGPASKRGKPGALLERVHPMPHRCNHGPHSNCSSVGQQAPTRTNLSCEHDHRVTERHRRPPASGARSYGMQPTLGSLATPDGPNPAGVVCGSGPSSPMPMATMRPPPSGPRALRPSPRPLNQPAMPSW